MRDIKTRTFDEAVRVLSRHDLMVLCALLMAAALGVFLSGKLGKALMMSPSGMDVGMGDMEMDEAVGNGLSLFSYLIITFAMWWTMMAAMMLPSAAPAILTYRTVSRRLSVQGARAAPSWLFISAYLFIWTGFSLAAVALQLLLARLELLTSMYAVTSATIGGTLLMVAGIYQFTSLKQNCVTGCQIPLHYFAPNWKSGYWGGWFLGLRYGVYCLGCCWLMMGLLFYGA